MAATYRYETTNATQEDTEGEEIDLELTDFESESDYLETESDKQFIEFDQLDDASYEPTEILSQTSDSISVDIDVCLS